MIILRATEFHTLNGRMEWYINYTTVRAVQKKDKDIFLHDSNTMIPSNVLPCHCPALSDTEIDHWFKVVTAKMFPQ